MAKRILQKWCYVTSRPSVQRWYSFCPLLLGCSCLVPSRHAVRKLKLPWGEAPTDSDSALTSLLEMWVSQPGSWSSTAFQHLPEVAGSNPQLRETMRKITVVLSHYIWGWYIMWHRSLIHGTQPSSPQWQGCPAEGYSELSWNPMWCGRWGESWQTCHRASELQFIHLYNGRC